MLILIFIAFTFLALGINIQVNPVRASTASAKKSDAVALEKLKIISTDTIKAIKNKDMKKLSTLIDQKKGLMISLSPFIEKESFIKFTNATLLNLNLEKNKKVKINWGIDDATGEPDKLTFTEFYKKYLFPVDYLGKGIEVNYNTIPLRSTSAHNFKDYFKSGIPVEYHFKGTEKNANLDWCSLILIYEKTNDILNLSAILVEHWRT